MEFLHITITGWVALSIALSMLFLAALMFILGREQAHYIWGIFCIAIATWAGGFYMVALAHSPESAKFWWKISYIGLILNPFLYTHFTLEFIESKSYRQFKLLVLSALYGVASVFLLLDIGTNLIIDKVTLLFNEIYYNAPPGALYFYFMTAFPLLVTVSLILIFREYEVRKNDQLFRQRALYFFIASLVAYIGGSMNFLPIYGIAISPVTNFAVAFGAIFIAYAILKYRLFDLKIVTAQLLTLILIVFSMIRLFLSGSAQEVIFNIVILIVTFSVGIYLIRSVKREVEQRELIEKQEKELEKANAEQETLLHFISHEIKGYLAKSEAGFAAIVEGDYGRVNDALRQMATVALGEVRKGVTTVMDILDAASLKKGTVAFSKHPFDLGAVVGAVVDELRSAAAEKKLHLEYRPPFRKITVEGDEEKFARHVIRNLVDNAIKYTPSGSVSVSLIPGARTAQFAVEDSGVGITTEDMRQLFTEGGRGKDSIKVNAHSTGYGLYIAKRIVVAHGGAIRAESGGAGKGSRFIVELPALE